MKLEVISRPEDAAGLALEGPYSLTVEGIGAAVPKQAIGVFALGHLDLYNRFRVEAVGRGDKDLGHELRALIGTAGLFKFSCFASAEEAFLKHCELFHKFRPPGNLIHPARAEGTDWRCPHCLGLHRDR